MKYIGNSISPLDVSYHILLVCEYAIPTFAELQNKEVICPVSGNPRKLPILYLQLDLKICIVKTGKTKGNLQ